MEEVVSYAALFSVFALRENRNKKRLRMRLRRKLNVYEFVTTKLSTRMNGNLHEISCKTSAQPHCLIILCRLCRV